MKEVFVIKKSAGSYYSYNDYDAWEPKFSFNQWEAAQFESYDKALEWLLKGSTEDEYGSKWLADDFYQIDKWFVIEDND